MDFPRLSTLPPKGRVARSIRAGGANPRAVAAMAHAPRIDPPAIQLADPSLWPMARTSAIVHPENRNIASQLTCDEHANIIFA